MKFCIRAAACVLVLPVFVLVGCGADGSASLQDVDTLNLTGAKAAASGAVQSIKDSLIILKDTGEELVDTAKETKEDIEDRVGKLNEGSRLIREAVSPH